MGCPTGIWVSSVYSWWGRVRTYTWNLPHPREVCWRLALPEVCFPLNLFKRLLFHLNEEQRKTHFSFPFLLFFSDQNSIFWPKLTLIPFSLLSATFPVQIKWMGDGSCPMHWNHNCLHLSHFLINNRKNKTMLLKHSPPTFSIRF